MAAEDGGRGLYLRFVDVVCTDVQYLLDETLRVLPEVRRPARPCLIAFYTQITLFRTTGRRDHCVRWLMIAPSRSAPGVLSRDCAKVRGV